MPDYSDEVEPLTKEENAWIRRLRRALKDCPKRLGVYTNGDATLYFYDKPICKAHDIQIEDGGDEKNGIDLGFVFSSVSIEGVSG